MAKKKKVCVQLTKKDVKSKKCEIMPKSEFKELNKRFKFKKVFELKRI